MKPVRFCCLSLIALFLAAWSMGRVLAAPIPGLEPASNWELDGYVKYLGTGTFPDTGADLGDHLLHQRFNFEYRFDSALRFNVGMRNRLLYGDTPKTPGYGDLIGGDPGFWDMSSTWLDRDGWVGNTQFDRAYADWTAGNGWQLRVGRFRINWAMTTLWNPNDIFNAYSIYDFDYEERAGADSVLLSKKLGFASALDFVYNPNQDSDLNSYAARYLLNHDGWDMQLLLGKSGFDRITGAGFAGDIYGAGFRGEFTYFDPVFDYWPRVDEVGNGISRLSTELFGMAQFMPLSPMSTPPPIADELETTTVATLEADYSFSGKRNYLIRGSVLHISNPTESDSALLYLNLPLTARTLSFSDWTYYFDVGFDISSLSRLTLTSSYYRDGSYFIGANGSYSLADDWQLLLVIQRFDGSSDSLFGKTAATLGFLQLKWSF
ncbi:hypothetical protein [uncultured Shewanella sp.]|uniref:hypothetical protein n=1 Tax=Shewanella atlantica TaxID=271099 RepID=UPI0026016B47|nr:hypothetical protein [uncultured Shewanella sp.]